LCDVVVVCCCFSPILFGIFLSLRGTKQSHGLSACPYCVTPPRLSAFDTPPRKGGEVCCELLFFHRFYLAFAFVLVSVPSILSLTFLFACPKRKVTKEKRHFLFKRSAKQKEAMLLCSFSVIARMFWDEAISRVECLHVLCGTTPSLRSTPLLRKEGSFLLFVVNCCCFSWFLKVPPLAKGRWH
jgi:hypothetical protein